MRILLALVLVAAGLLAGALIRGKSSTASAPTTTTSVPTIVVIPTSSSPTPSNGADLQILRGGCLALQEVAGAITQAQADGTAVQVPTGPGSAWSSVNAIGGIEDMPAYQQIASDSGILIQYLGEGDTSDSSGALSQMESDCSALDMPTAA